MLHVENLTAGYGAMRIISGVTAQFPMGSVTAIVGRNGAGKTTLVNAMAGLRYGQNSGVVRLGAVDLGALKPSDVLRRGLSLVLDGHRVFPQLSVCENLLVGGYVRRMRKAEALAQAQKSVELFPILGSMWRRPAGLLSGGQQQMVTIAQALLSDPKVLIIDEPAAGLASIVTDEIYRALASLASTGLGVIVVEQSLERSMQHSAQCIVLEGGKIARSGPTAELRNDPVVGAVISGRAVMQQ